MKASARITLDTKNEFWVMWKSELHEIGSWHIIFPLPYSGWVFLRLLTDGGGPKRSPLPKIYHTYPRMIKIGAVILYLKKIQKKKDSRDTPLEFCWHQHFLLEISTLCYIKKYRFRLHFDALFQFLLSFFESLKIVLINMVIILMMSAKMAALGKNTFKIKGILN